MNDHLRCASCGLQYPIYDQRYRCVCGGTLDVQRDLDAIALTTDLLDQRRNSSDPWTVPACGGSAS